MLNDKWELWSSKAARAVIEEAQAKHESCQIENDCTNEENVIARDIESAVKKLVMTERATMVEELPDYILMTSFQKGQSCIRSVDYNVIEKIMLDFLERKELARLKTHISWSF